MSFVVGVGEYVCIAGASGSGKSTLLGLISGLILPDIGQILIDGTSLGETSDAGRARLRLEKIGVVYQHDNLIDEFTVGENVSFPLELRSLHRDDLEAEVERLLSLVGLEGFADRRPSELSVGQQQRVGIARALGGDRRLLVADEPSASLDSKTSEALFELFGELVTSGVSIVLASHDPLAQKRANRVLEMIDGRVRES